MRGIVEAGLAASYPPEVRHNAEDFRRFRARWLANDPHSFAAINRMLADSTVTEELSRVACPTLVAWSVHDDLEDRYGDPLAVWRAWAPEVGGARIDSGHHMAEEAPEQLAATLGEFLGGA